MPARALQVNVVESALRQSTSAVSLSVHIVILLNRHTAPRNALHPSNMSIVASIRLRNRARLWRAVDGDAGRARGLVPAVCVAPVVALVLVGEVDALAVVDAVGDKAGALALVEVPGVDAAAAAAVRVVVGAGGEGVGCVFGGDGGGGCGGGAEEDGGKLGELHDCGCGGDGWMGMFVWCKWELDVSYGVDVVLKKLCHPTSLYIPQSMAMGSLRKLSSTSRDQLLYSNSCLSTGSNIVSRHAALRSALKAALIILHLLETAATLCAKLARINTAVGFIHQILTIAAQYHDYLAFLVL